MVSSEQREREVSDAFDACRLRIDDAPPSPLPRRVLAVLLLLLLAIIVGVTLGRLDIVAIAEGRLVPRSLVQIVQPADAGIVRELLVDEGASVLAGQPLLRLDARLADADLRADRAQLHQRLLQLRRIDAELADSDALQAEPDDPPEALERARAQLRANRSAYGDMLGQARAQVARATQELAAATEVEAKLASTVPIVRTMASRYERLRSEGFVSELYALERERERIEREQDLSAQRHTVQALRSQLEQALRQKAHVESGARRQLHAERSEAAAARDKLREEIDKQRVRREHIELIAPANGTVNEIATRTLGSVVSAGTVLVTIVPSGEPLEADVLVRNEDAAFVRAGQRALLKIAAYPFQKYGLLEATVVRIAADSNDRGTAARRGGADEAHLGVYRARIALAQQALAVEGERLPLASGMAVAAEVHLGQRPVLDYVLAPMKKAWHESARER